MLLLWIWRMRSRYMMAPPRLPCWNRVREAVSGTPPKRRGALYPVPEDGFGLGEQVVELLSRGMEDGEDGRDVVESVAAAGGEHEGFPPAQRLTQTGCGKDHIGIGGGERLGRVPFLVQELVRVRGSTGLKAAWRVRGDKRQLVVSARYELGYGLAWVSN